jgi:hypothetical protein
MQPKVETINPPRPNGILKSFKPFLCHPRQAFTRMRRTPSSNLHS